MNARWHRRSHTVRAGLLVSILLAAVPFFWSPASAQRGGALNADLPAFNNAMARTVPELKDK